MVKIISASLSEEEASKLDELSRQGNFSGRSETIRSAIELLSQEQELKNDLRGNASAILLVVHRHSKHTLKISHDYQHIIKNHNHSHLQNEKCIDVFILEGSAIEIKRIEEKFRKDKRTMLSKLVII